MEKHFHKKLFINSFVIVTNFKNEFIHQYYYICLSLLASLLSVNGQRVVLITYKNKEKPFSSRMAFLV